MMNRFQFQAVLDNLHTKEKQLNGTKVNEYARDQDVLARFRDTADEIGVPTRAIIYTFMQEQWREIQRYCHIGELHSDSESLETRVLQLNWFSKLLLAELLEAENWCIDEQIYPDGIVETEDD